MEIWFYMAARSNFTVESDLAATDLHPCGWFGLQATKKLAAFFTRQSTWYSLLFEVIDFFVAKREKSGVALTMSLGKWETITVKRHYRPRVIRLNGIDPRWSELANDLRSHCRPRCNNQPRKSSLKNWKLKNLCAFLETSQLLYAALMP